MSSRFSPAADPYAIPPEHSEAYAEMCQQFTQGVLRLYRDATRTTIMREMPNSLQINALTSGAFIGAIVPLMLQTRRTDDASVEKALQGSLHLIIKHARKIADDIERL